jgi:Rod binding domain-containing protein
LSDAKDVSASHLASRPPNAKKVADPAQKFEAFVLQTFIQEMMPEDAESVFGSGVAGGFWKSMMSEKIAEQVAARGNLGIADMVRAGHAAAARPGPVASPDVLSHLATMNDGFAAQLAVKPDSGA